MRKVRQSQNDDEIGKISGDHEHKVDLSCTQKGSRDGASIGSCEEESSTSCPMTISSKHCGRAVRDRHEDSIVEYCHCERWNKSKSTDVCYDANILRWDQNRCSSKRERRDERTNSRNAPEKSKDCLRNLGVVVHAISSEEEKQRSKPDRGCKYPGCRPQRGVTIMISQLSWKHLSEKTINGEQPKRRSYIPTKSNAVYRDSPIKILKMK